MSPLSPLSTGKRPQIPFVRIGWPRHSDLSRSGVTNRQRGRNSRRRQCREGRYPSGRRPGTLWWGSRKEARGSGETLSRTHFSGVRQNLSLRAMELRKAAWRACSKGRPHRLRRVRPERNGRSGSRVRPVEKSRTDNRRLAGKMSNEWSPACRKDVRRMVAGSPERRPTDGNGACLAEV